ncbi:MAG: TadE family protein [Geobacteraceae bacterium]
MNGMNSKGQALVEMAIIIPLLMLLVMGIFEFGRAMYIKNTLTQAARSGARSAVVTKELVSPLLNKECSDTSIVIQTTCNSLYSGIDKSDSGLKLNVKVFAPGDDPATATPKTTNATTPPSPGDTVEVQVNITNFRSKYRIIPIIPLPTTLVGTTAMRYE